MEIFKLKGKTKNYLWGGNRLKEYGKVSNDIIAESWEFSIHPDGISMVESGKEKGKDLNTYILEHPEIIGNDKQVAIMIKYIDALKPLSIQVHPNDEYALKVEGELGKTEMWYIIDASEDAYIYYGVNKAVSTSEIRQRIKDNTILEVLNKVKTHKGDCFLIEAGTIHAIGEGNLICEIQENSNSTYRLYDYNRKDINGNLRELHIDKAMDVVRVIPNEVAKEVNENSDYRLLTSCEYFKVELYKVNSITLNTGIKYQVINFLNGSGKIENLEFNKGDSFFIPSNYGKYHIEGDCEFIKTTS